MPLRTVMLNKKRTQLQAQLKQLRAKRKKLRTDEEELQAKIDALVIDLVTRQHEKAIGILKENRAKLDELADFLYSRETITGEEFMEILNK